MTEEEAMLGATAQEKIDKGLDESLAKATREGELKKLIHAAKGLDVDPQIIALLQNEVE
jgi:hypothetical protein